MRDAERAEWDCAQLRRRSHDPLVPAVGDKKTEIDGRLGGGERLRQRASVVQIVEGADRKICNAIGQDTTFIPFQRENRRFLVATRLLLSSRHGSPQGSSNVADNYISGGERQSPIR